MTINLIYRLLYAEVVTYKLNDNHKSKTTHRHAWNKEKGFQGHHYRKPADREKRQQEKKGTNKNYKNNHKISNKMAKVHTYQ